MIEVAMSSLSDSSLGDIAKAGGLLELFLGPVSTSILLAVHTMVILGQIC